VVDNLSCISVLNDFDWLFDDSVEWLDDLNDFLNDLFLDDFNLNKLLNNFFNNYDLLLDHLDFSDLRNGVVHNLLDVNWFFNFDDSLNDDFNFDDFGNLDDSLHNSLDYSWHLYDLL